MNPPRMHQQLTTPFGIWLACGTSRHALSTTNAQLVTCQRCRRSNEQRKDPYPEAREP